MKDHKEFTLTDDHVKLLAAANVGWNDYAYEGAPGVNLKRPYGNSSGVDRDIARILGWSVFVDADGEEHLTKEQRELAWRLHRETEQALQVVLATGGFTSGVYRTSSPYSRDWTLVDEVQS